jgi:hypothetical protein
MKHELTEPRRAVLGFDGSSGPSPLNQTPQLAFEGKLENRGEYFFMPSLFALRWLTELR